MSGDRQGLPSVHDQSMHGIGLILKEFSNAAVDYSHPAEENFGSYSADPSEAELQQSFITAALSNILDEDKLSDEETGGQEEDERSEYRAEDISIGPGNGMSLLILIPSQGQLMWYLQKGTWG